MPGASNLNYDNAGHLLTINHRVLTYNTWGQLETVTENDPVQGYPLWRVRYAYDSLGRRIRRDYDELGYLSTQDPNGPISTLKSDSRWYDFDGDTLIGEERIDRQYMNQPLASVPLSTEGEQRTRLLAQSFEHSPFAARSDLSDSSALAALTGNSGGVRGPFADPFASLTTFTITGDLAFRAVNAIALQGGGYGQQQYVSYMGNGFVELFLAGVYEGRGYQGEYSPSGELVRVRDTDGAVLAEAVGTPQDAHGNGGGAQFAGYPFTTGGAYQDPATGYSSDPDSGLNGSYDSAMGSDAEDEEYGSPKAFYRAHMRDGRKELLASRPFQPGSDARRLVADLARRVPFAGQAYSGYTAITGYDPISGECLSVWERAGEAFSAVPTIPHGGGGGGSIARIAKEEKRISPLVIPIRGGMKNNSYAIRIAEKLEKPVQIEVNDLIRKLREGNVNPGIGTRSLGRGFFELRGENLGRVIVKLNNKGGYDIVGKFLGHKRGDAANSAMIKQLMEGYESL